SAVCTVVPSTAVLFVPHRYKSPRGTGRRPAHGGAFGVGTEAPPPARHLGASLTGSVRPAHRPDEEPLGLRRQDRSRPQLPTAPAHRARGAGGGRRGGGGGVGGGGGRWGGGVGWGWQPSGGRGPGGPPAAELARPRISSKPAAMYPPWTDPGGPS